MFTVKVEIVENGQRTAAWAYFGPHFTSLQAAKEFVGDLGDPRAQPEKQAYIWTEVPK